jgi:SSS family solute:Na+ symporter
MHLIDWAVVGVYLVWIVWDGLRRSKSTHEVEGYFLANRSLPWWAVGLSVMATQLSAVTLVGTTGRGYAEGLSVMQLYLGLPLAMVILSVTVVPFFYRAGVFTAYEYLEKRFDVRTRTMASALFLLSRSLSCGVIIAAPAIILSIVLGWNLQLTILGIGVPTVLYTMVGGVQAVTWTDVKQMGVIISAVGVAIVILLFQLPDHVTLGGALHVAGATGRLTALDFQWDPNKTYTFWSGLIGGLFLMLSYFGCDQSQVQRYLTAKSVKDGRRSLLMSAYWKIPLQFMIPMIGVLIFVFYLFNQPPMLFNRQHDAAVRASARGAEYVALEQQFGAAFEARRITAEEATVAREGGDAGRIAETEQEFREAEASVSAVRAKAVNLVQEVTGDRQFGDVNYVFPTFVTQHMPVGLVGLIIAAIFAAAMSSIAAELNSISTATIIDFYKRFAKSERSDAHYLRASKVVTGMWGLVACVVAMFATSLGPLIDVVNRFGSFFYGSLLGVFILAIATKRATSRGAFWGLLAGMAAVAVVAFGTPIAFLWHNVVGAFTVVVVGMAISLADRHSRAA